MRDSVRQKTRSTLLDLIWSMTKKCCTLMWCVCLPLDAQPFFGQFHWALVVLKTLYCHLCEHLVHSKNIASTKLVALSHLLQIILLLRNSVFIFFCFFGVPYTAPLLKERSSLVWLFILRCTAKVASTQQ